MALPLSVLAQTSHALTNPLARHQRRTTCSGPWPSASPISVAAQSTFELLAVSHKGLSEEYPPGTIPLFFIKSNTGVMLGRVTGLSIIMLTAGTTVQLSRMAFTSE